MNKRFSEFCMMILKQTYLFRISDLLCDQPLVLIISCYTVWVRCARENTDGVQAYEGDFKGNPRTTGICMAVSSSAVEKCSFKSHNYH